MGLYPSNETKGVKSRGVLTHNTKMKKKKGGGSVVDISICPFTHKILRNIKQKKKESNHSIDDPVLYEFIQIKHSVKSISLLMNGTLPYQISTVRR